MQDLPASIVRAGGSGRTTLQLVVGEDGKVTSCAGVRATGSPVFPEFACEMVTKYMRYEPALDAGNRPVATLVTTTFAYQMR